MRSRENLVPYNLRLHQAAKDSGCGPTFPEDIKFDDLYFQLWWFMTGRWLRHLFLITWTTLSSFYVVFAYIVYMAIFSPLYLIGGAAGTQTFIKIEEKFFNLVLEIVASWNYAANYHIIESGDSLDDILHQTFLFLPNHQSTADVPICMSIFTSRHRCAGKIMWIMDESFKFTHFGVASQIHDDFFISCGKENRNKSLVELGDHLKQVFVKKNRRYLILFPEGGFLWKQRTSSHKFAQKNGLPLLQHCTLPRTSAFEVIIQVLRPHVGSPNEGMKVEEKPILDKIVDVTIAYPKGNPIGLLDILSAWREPCTIHVHYKVFDVNELPTIPDDMRQWMYTLYFEKEKLLEEFYRTGAFPLGVTDTKAVRMPGELLHNPMRFLLLYCFFITSACLFLAMFSIAYSYFFHINKIS